MTTTELTPTARTKQHEASDVWARINRAFAGSFTTPAAKQSAIKDLQRMEVLARDLRRELKAK